MKNRYFYVEDALGPHVLPLNRFLDYIDTLLIKNRDIRQLHIIELDERINKQEAMDIASNMGIHIPSYADKDFHLIILHALGYEKS